MDKNQIIENEIKRIESIIKFYQKMQTYLGLQKEIIFEDIEVSRNNTVTKKSSGYKKKKLMRPTATAVFNYLKNHGSGVAVYEIINLLKDNKIGNWEKGKYALNGLKRSLEGNEIFQLIEDAPEFENKKFGLTEWENVNVDEEIALSSSTDGVPRESKG